MSYNKYSTYIIDVGFFMAMHVYHGFHKVCRPNSQFPFLVSGGNPEGAVARRAGGHGSGASGGAGHPDGSIRSGRHPRAAGASPRGRRAVATDHAAAAGACRL